MNRSCVGLVGIVTCCLFAAACAPAGGDAFPVLTGAYLGQTPPGDTAELFAPGIVSTGMYTRDVAMTPDGSEIYFGVLMGRFTVILQTKLQDGRWTEPEVAPFSQNPRYLNLEPHISPDGQRFFFLSTRPPDGAAVEDEDIGAWVNQDIWVMDRVDDGWSEPYNLGAPVNSDDAEFFPSVTRDGTIYFTRGGQQSYIYRSRLVDGSYTEPERLGSEVNSTEAQYNAFIAPDESYIIVCTGGRVDGKGGPDYYVVFRNDDDSWTEPINMGDAVNTVRAEFSPYVSPDGKYFFFMSSRWGSAESLPQRLTRDYLMESFGKPQNGSAAIYWIDAGFIEALRPD